MLTDLAISMAGSGNWRVFFPDDTAYDLYKRLYPDGADQGALSPGEARRVETWISARFAHVDEGRIVPRMPVMRLSDYELFTEWFRAASENAASVVSAVVDQYRHLAGRLADGGVSVDNVLTVLLCGHTLDVGTLRQLEAGVVGEPPERAGSGRYFLWGKETPSFTRYHYGVNTMGTQQFVLRFIWGRKIPRIARGRKSLCIPVFDREAMSDVNDLCRATSKKLAEAFTAGVAGLDPLIDQATFSRCSRGDVLCMLFHAGYERIAETLVSMGILPDFPEEVDDSWGIWVHWQE